MSSVEPRASSFRLKALRSLPSFRGKENIARRLLTREEKGHCTLVRDRYGNDMVVPNLFEPVGFSLGINGSYEPDVIDFLRSLLNRDTDFIDIGANIGALTLALAEHARRVLAIEASPLVVDYLRRNIELNRKTNVTVVACAASRPGVGSVPFYMPPVKFAMGSSAAQFNVDPVEIAACALDQVVTGEEWRVGVVKIDVEGFEAHVLLGASGLLHSDAAPSIVMEFCDWAEERAFPGRRGWAQQILLDAGYTLWLMEEYRRHGDPLSAPVTDGFHTIFARK